MARYDYASYFGRIREIERLVVPSDGVGWMERYTKPDKPVDVLLYLGCNVLMTAHLAQEVVQVFDAIGVNFAAVGGPQFCCGIVHYGRGDLGASSRLTRATIAKFESFGATQVVMWCPSCNKHFDDVVLRELAPRFSITHATAFLAERAERLPFCRDVNRRVAVHQHVGRAQQEADADAARRLLSAIPGLTVTGSVADPELDYHCNNVTIERVGHQNFQRIRRTLAGAAAAQGADTVATIYHSCHREWSDLDDHGLSLRNYISLVCESLGLGEQDNYQNYRRSGDAEAIVQSSRAAWESHGLTEQQARVLAQRHFAAPTYPAEGSVDSG
jgi:heterodisulfide reductase subunit D